MDYLMQVKQVTGNWWTLSDYTMLWKTTDDIFQTQM